MAASGDLYFSKRHGPLIMKIYDTKKHSGNLPPFRKVTTLTGPWTINSVRHSAIAAVGKPGTDLYIIITLLSESGHRSI